MVKKLEKARRQSSPLAEVLRYCGMTREQAAEELLVSASTVNNWCSGRHDMTLQHFTRLLSMVARCEGVSSGEMQSLVLKFLLHNGLSSQAALKLLPPARLLRQQMVLFIAPEALTRGNRMAILGARDYLRHVGVDMLIASTYQSVRRLDNSLAELIEAVEPRGVLVSKMVDPESVALIADVARERRIPVVGMFKAGRLKEKLRCVVEIDDFETGYRVGTFLMERGCSRIGFFGTKAVESGNVNRFLGLRHALEEQGRTIPRGSVFWGPRFFHSTPDDSVAWAAHVQDEPVHLTLARRVLWQLERGNIDGVFCASEPATSALIRVVNATDGQAPNRYLSNVVGVATSAWPDFFPGPRFPYVLVPAYEIGRQAAKLVFLADSGWIAEDVLYQVKVECELRQPARM